MTTAAQQSNSHTVQVGDSGGLTPFYSALQAACALRECATDNFAADETAKITHLYGMPL